MDLRDFQITECTPHDNELAELLRRADAEFISRYPELRGRRRGALFSDIRFLIAYHFEVAVGCAGLQRSGHESTASSYEVKRLYVTSEVRRSGAAGALMASLEDLARRLGAESVFFETGVRQPEAIRLALRHGYIPIDPYPPYLDDPFAQCFRKDIAAAL